MFRLPHRIFVADNQTRVHFLAEPQQAVIGIAPQYKADAAFTQSFGDVRDTVIQNSVVPKVGMGIGRYGCEEGNNRFAQYVAGLDSDVQGRIVERSLRSLHPVHNTFALGIGGTGSAHADARVGNELFEKQDRWSFGE